MQYEHTVNTPADYQPLGSREWYQYDRYREADELTGLVKPYGRLLSEYLINALDLTFPEGAELETAIGERLEGVRVYTSNLRKSIDKEEGGFFDVNERIIVINDDSDEDHKLEYLEHEIVHAAALSASVHPTALSSDARNTLNGVHSYHYNFRVGKSDPGRKIEGGRWLNEAMIEHVRRKVFGVQTSEAEDGYQVEVMLLRALFEVDPALEKQMIKSTFVDPNKGAVWGAIENIVGLLWIEETEIILGRDLAEFPLEIVEAIHDKEAQKIFASSIIRQAKEQGLHR